MAAFYSQCFVDRKNEYFCCSLLCNEILAEFFSSKSGQKVQGNLPRALHRNTFKWQHVTKRIEKGKIRAKSAENLDEMNSALLIWFH